jgi:hypothetical protein
MFKVVSAAAVGAFIAAAMTVFLSFAKVEASVPGTIQEVGDCSDDRVWPNPCLREIGYEILKDRMIGAERARGLARAQRPTLTG